MSLLPATLYLLERIATWLPGITALLSLRNLARNSHQYSALITLLLLTAGLGTYITSFARTLDDNLIARTYYRIGAKIALIEGAGVIDGVQRPACIGQYGDNHAEHRFDDRPQPAPQIGKGLPSWAILPASEHLRVAGVRALHAWGAIRPVSRWRIRWSTPNCLASTGKTSRASPIFASDFAPLALGTLMNELALEPAGILVSRAFLQKTTLQVGNTIELRGLIAGASQPLLFKIVGVLNLFPTAYPGDQEFFVANLEYIFNELGGPIPYEVSNTKLKVEQKN